MQAARKYDYYERLLNTAPEEPRRKESTRRETQKGIRITSQAVCCVLVVFVAMTLVLIRYAALSEQKVHIYQTKSEIKALQITRDELIAERDRGMSLEKIETVARQNLGMQYPVQSQIVYIDASKRYTLKETAGDTGSEHPNLVQWLGQSFNKLTAAGIGSNRPQSGN